MKSGPPCLTHIVKNEDTDFDMNIMHREHLNCQLQTGQGTSLYIAKKRGNLSDVD
jgi:hypothetical protein